MCRVPVGLPDVIRVRGTRDCIMDQAITDFFNDNMIKLDLDFYEVVRVGDFFHVQDGYSGAIKFIIKRYNREISNEVPAG